MQTKILEQIGMSNSEIKVYFALQELGTSTVGPILEKSKVPNSKIYLLLSRLTERGLITSTIKHNTKTFIAESPNRLLDYIDLKKQELDKDKEEIKKILPDIISKQNKTSENNARVFEGRRGLYSAYEDILETLKKGEEQLYFSLGNEDFSKKWIVNFFKEYEQKRAKLGISSKGIYPKNCKKIFRENKYHKVKYKDFPFPTGIVIYSNKVLILDFDNLIVFRLDSYEIADKYRKLFYKFWNN